MLPPTHFIIAYAAGLILNGLGLLPIEYVIGTGLLAMFIDIDHYIRHMVLAKSHRFSLRAVWNDSMQYHKLHQRSVIHKTSISFVIAPLFLAIALMDVNLSAMMVVGYFSHIILDSMPVRKNIHRYIHFCGLYIRTSFLEIILDVVGIMLIISLHLIRPVI